MVLTIVAAIFVFGMLVLVHELGHFATAKMTNMRVDEFAIGFGPKIFSVKKGETVYSLRAVPLGGFNKIAGMEGDMPSSGEKDASETGNYFEHEEGYEDPGDRAYYKRPIWARMIVIVAGSFMNFILPVFIFFGIFLAAGVAVPSTEPVVGGVVAEHPAALAGLQKNDRILTIDGKEIKEWKDISSIVAGAAGKPFKLTYQRGEEVKSTTIIPVADPNNSKRTIIGITGTAVVRDAGIFEAMEMSIKKTVFMIGAMLGAVAQLFQGHGTESLSGPVGVVQMTGEVAQLGFIPLMNFAAMLSLNLGIVNLLPIPALDGGHFVALAIEAVRGKPMGPKITYYVHMTGIVLLVSLMLFATFNDIMR